MELTNLELLRRLKCRNSQISSEIYFHLIPHNTLDWSLQHNRLQHQQHGRNSLDSSCYIQLTVVLRRRMSDEIELKLIWIYSVNSCRTLLNVTSHFFRKENEKMYSKESEEANKGLKSRKHFSWQAIRQKQQHFFHLMDLDIFGTSEPRGTKSQSSEPFDLLNSRVDFCWFLSFFLHPFRVLRKLNIIDVPSIYPRVIHVVLLP